MRITSLVSWLLLSETANARRGKAVAPKPEITKTLIPELSFGEPYITHDYHNQNYDINGDTVLSRKACLLTSDKQGQRGWLSAGRRLLPENFEIEVEFRLDGEGKSMYGDGVAFWFLDPGQSIEAGPVFGVQDHLRGSAVIIDTYRNNRPGKAFPYVIFMDSGHEAYDADHDGKANELAGFSARGLHNAAQDVSVIRFSYQSGGTFKTEINYKGKWDTGFSLLHDFKLPRQFAISASTGQLSENVHIKKIQVSELSPLPMSERKHLADQAGRAKQQQQLKSSKKREQYTKPSNSKSSGSWFWKLVFWAAVIAGCVYGFKVWQSKSKSRGGRKKFGDMNLRY